MSELDDNILDYLKKYKPYLYDLEMEVNRIQQATGWGDISFSCIVRSKKVFSSDVSGWVKNLYKEELTRK